MLRVKTYFLFYYLSQMKTFYELLLSIENIWHGFITTRTPTGKLSSDNRTSHGWETAWQISVLLGSASIMSQI